MLLLLNALVSNGNGSDGSKGVLHMYHTSLGINRMGRLAPQVFECMLCTTGARLVCSTQLDGEGEGSGMDKCRGRCC
jgi:hypothetical protein